MNCATSRQATFGSWPRQSPSVEDLVDAGFYYSGDPDSEDDTVTCFCCDKELSGWEDGDDPLLEHLAHPKTKAGCSWAFLMMEKREPKSAPTSAAMTKAREVTFRGWPYEKERGWVGKAKKVANLWHIKAPWLTVEDGKECIYCHLVLDGWEIKDDPLKEHEKRARDLNCAFFKGLPPRGAAESIFALTKNAFAKGKNQESSPATDLDIASSAPLHSRRKVQKSSLAPSEITVEESASTVVEKKKSTKRKLPPVKSKKAIVMDDVSDEDVTIADPIPIILKSARKKPRTEETHLNVIEIEKSTTPIRASRTRRARSNSISSTVNYAESFSPEVVRPKRLSSKVGARRARTPLEELSSPNMLDHSENGSVAVPTIKEEEDDINMNGSDSSRGRAATTQDCENPSSEDKENTNRRKRPRGRASSSSRKTSSISNPIRRLSSTVFDTPVEVVISSDPSSRGTLTRNEQLPLTIEEDDELEEEHGGPECHEQQPMTITSSVTISDDSTSITRPEIDSREDVSNAPDIDRESAASVRKKGIGKTKAALKVKNNTIARRASSRRGSKTTRKVNLEEIVNLASSSSSATKTQLPFVAEPERPQSSEKSVMKVTRSLSSTQKCTSSRNEGSDTAQDMIMLDHKAQPKLGPSCHQIVSVSSCQSSNDLFGLSIDEEPEVDVEPRNDDLHSGSAAAASVELVVDGADFETTPTTAVEFRSPGVLVDIELDSQSDCGNALMLVERHDPTHSSFIQDITHISAEEPQWRMLLQELDIHPRPSTDQVTLSPASLGEGDLNVEQWLRKMTQEEAVRMQADCERMVNKLVEKGQAARSMILNA